MTGNTLGPCETCKAFRDNRCTAPHSPYGGKVRLPQMGCWAWRKTAAPSDIGEQSIMEDQALRIGALKAALRNPPKHVWWSAGEPDCPRDIIAGNGELHTLLCKVCGKRLSDGRICLAGLPK